MDWFTAHWGEIASIVAIVFAWFAPSPIKPKAK